jgi:CRP-like cAMP-binding protein
VALQNVRLFASFTEEERAALAERLVYAPFVRGDVITRQGAVSHWLYLLVEGEADIWLEAPDQPRRLLTTLHAGDIFGEMGLLTGEPRRATVTARTDVQCYRLDKAGFEDIIQSRPGIAEEVSHVLAEREAEILQVRQAMDQEATGRAVAASRTTIVGKIRSFFGLT